MVAAAVLNFVQKCDMDDINASMVNVYPPNKFEASIFISD